MSWRWLSIPNVVHFGAPAITRFHQLEKQTMLSACDSRDPHPSDREVHMRKLKVVGMLPILFAASFLLAQDSPEFPAPQKEHEWLLQFVGEWETESEALAAPGGPAMKCKGTIHSRTLGGFWVVSELKSEMMGKPMVAVQTLGYDPQSKKFIGTWVDSMMSHLWKYEGTIDRSGKVLTLEADGPSFTQPGKLARYRDVYEFKGKDQVVLSSSSQGEDGKWITFMTGSANRKK
jgi:hypothetical protein